LRNLQVLSLDSSFSIDREEPNARYAYQVARWVPRKHDGADMLAACSLTLTLSVRSESIQRLHLYSPACGVMPAQSAPQEYSLEAAFDPALCLVHERSLDAPSLPQCWCKPCCRPHHPVCSPQDSDDLSSPDGAFAPYVCMQGPEPADGRVAEGRWGWGWAWNYSGFSYLHAWPQPRIWSWSWSWSWSHVGHGPGLSLLTGSILQLLLMRL
jgi:hypothetical protein